MKTPTEVDVSRAERSSDIVARRCLSMTSFPPLAVARRRLAEITRNGRLHAVAPEFKGIVILHGRDRKQSIRVCSRQTTK